jgi:stage V sporulation protein D (sporulation-specific penicillin-binding protein)
LAGPSILIKKRLLVILVFFTLVAVSLLGRVAYIQVVKGESLQKKAFEQHNLSIIISPRRGTVYDRNGKELAVSASVETIYVNNQDIEKSNKDKEMIAEELAQILELDKEAVLKKLNKKSEYEVIKKKVDREVGDRVRRWIEEDNISGVYIVEDTKRYYPYRNLAAHVIGFTGDDNQGLNGIEIMMEQYLKGVPGRVLSEVDAKNRALPFKIEKRIDPQDGLNVILTIDETIQYFAQKALEKAIDDYKVKDGAIAIVMDPRNGDVLAMVSKPDFDLNNPFGPPPGIDPGTWNGHTDEDVNTLSKTVWRNKAISDTYEPGSTFKAITSAAGLEEGIVTPETRTNDSPVVIGKWNFKCWRHYNPHGEVSFAEGVYNSCNPVFVKVAQSLGIDRFYSYVKAFGFYDKTGISLPGESKGMFHATPTETDMAAASFGQRFTITPMQLITSYTAIANGGKLMKPRLVRELTDSEGNIVKKFEPEVIRPVISKKTSETLREILEGVVSIGTGKNAYVKGYRVAGKTGTSETTEEGVYTASFMALAPADNPVVCVLVALFNPQGDSYMGGVIAAPVAGELIEDILDYLEVERRYTEQDKQMIVQEVYVPEVRGKSVEEAVKRLREFGLEYKIEGDADNKNAVVLEQTPKPDASIPQKSVVILYTYKPEEEIKVKMPDVLNKTISEATQALADVGLNIKVEGMGNAWRQEFQPGTELEKGKVVEVEFRYLDNVE